ncbi:alpha/beta fold hydrolase [Streptomyces sp. NPDC094032]|uniref:thioesterase II family protein n=1 Tax=Streptomyces sp. NPDC094032 TaxID=3155308 RepID=UPI00332B76AD
MTETAVRRPAGPAAGSAGDGPPALYCFPHAGGGAASFRLWQEAVGPLARVRTVAPPPPAGRPGASVRELAVLAADRLGRLDPGAVLLGHSMGALVAFETVRELVRRGRPSPAALVVVAHAAPHAPRARAAISALPSDAFWAEVEAMGGTSDEVLARPELRAATEPRLRADFAACEAYRFAPGPPLPCRVIGYVGSSDRQASAASMQPWRMHTLDGFSLTERPGGHFFLHEEPREVVADALRQSRSERWEEARC